jgi:hypothetical protein
MVHLAIHEILLLLWLVLISSSRNCLSGRALPCKVTSQPILETGSAIFGFPKLVHYVRLEQLGEGLVVCSGEMVATHWIDLPIDEASASGSLDTTPENSVVASGMEDAVHESMSEPSSGF